MCLDIKLVTTNMKTIVCTFYFKTYSWGRIAPISLSYSALTISIWDSCVSEIL